MLLPICLALGTLAPAAKGDLERVDYAVVVHAENPTRSLSSAQLRRVFKAESRDWPSRHSVVLLLPRVGTGAKQVLLDRVYSMTDRQLKQYWLRLIYQNKLVEPPRVVPSAEIALRLLERYHGAISIVPADQLTEGGEVLVLTVDGKLPGEAGYPLHRLVERPAVGPVEAASGLVEPAAAEGERELDLDLARELESWSALPGVHLQLFGHAEYEYEEERVAGTTTDTNAFSIESLDLLVTAALSERTSVLAETVIDALDDDGYDVDVERLVLSHRFSDALRVSGGRFLTGIGYWNTRYHHGEWLQTSIDRPEILDFEDDAGLLPIHSVGVGASGELYTGALTFGYTVELANGRGATPTVTQNKEDGNTLKALNLALTVRPEALPGLGLGAGVYLDDIPENTDPSAGAVHSGIDETITSFFVTYDDNSWELMGEYFLLDHDVSGAPREDHSGWYVQAGRHMGRWTPYVRLDAVERDDADSFFGEAGDGLTSALGVRYDFEYVAFTLQYEHSELDAPPGDDDEETDTLVLQASFVF